MFFFHSVFVVILSIFMELLHVKYLSIFFMIASLALGQLNCPSASEVILKDMGNSPHKNIPKFNPKLGCYKKIYFHNRKDFVSYRFCGHDFCSVTYSAFVSHICSSYVNCEWGWICKYLEIFAHHLNLTCQPSLGWRGYLNTWSVYLAEMELVLTSDKLSLTLNMKLNFIQFPWPFGWLKSITIWKIIDYVEGYFARF